MKLLILPSVSLLVFSLVVLAFRAKEFVLGDAFVRNAARFLVAASVIPIAAMIFVLVSYLIYPNFFDHYEAVVAYISQQALHNQPIYPDRSTFIEAPYGPLLFFINQQFVPATTSLIYLKIPGTVTFVAGTLLFLLLLWWRFRSATMTVIAAGVLLSFDIYFQYDTFAFWNRAEPFLILCAIASVIILETVPTVAAAILLGVVCGIATGLKLHASVYAFPAVLAVWVTLPGRRSQLALACLTGLTALVVALVPLAFLQEPTTVSNYLDVILMTSKHALFPVLFVQNLMISLSMFVPTLVLAGLHRQFLAREDFGLVAGLAVALAVCTFVGSKAGAGPHHLLPLVPVAIYAFLRVAQAGRAFPGPNRVSCAVMIATAVAILVPFSAYTAVRTRTVAVKVANLQTEKAKVAELLNLKERYPDAEFGVSDDKHFEDYFYRILALNDKKKVVDFSAWMDYAFAGYSDALIEAPLLKQPGTVWIFPQGEPFSATNFYTEKPILSDRFRQSFAAHCVKTDNRTYFQVWTCGG